jgi:hypothetical protein
MVTGPEGAHAAPRAADRHLWAAERPGVSPYGETLRWLDIAGEQSACAHGAEAIYNEWPVEPNEWR